MIWNQALNLLCNEILNSVYTAQISLLQNNYYIMNFREDKSVAAGSSRWHIVVMEEVRQIIPAAQQNHQRYAETGSSGDGWSEQRACVAKWTFLTHIIFSSLFEIMD